VCAPGTCAAGHAGIVSAIREIATGPFFHVVLACAQFRKFMRSAYYFALRLGRIEV
jgi:chloramphenicol 3-O-phosphotransferase